MSSAPNSPDPANQARRPWSPTDAEVKAWAIALRRDLFERVVGGRAPNWRRDDHRAGDIAQNGVLQFLRDPRRYMSEYPDAHQLARAMIANLIRNFERDERGDRGEGTVLAIGPDGQPTVRRHVDSIERLLDDVGYHVRPLQVAASSLSTDVVMRKHRRQLIRRMMSMLSDDDADLIRLVYLKDLDPLVVADGLGITAETVRQRLSRARSRCRAILQQLDGEFDVYERRRTAQG